MATEVFPVVRKSKSPYASISHGFACIIFANIPLAKASHVTKLGIQCVDKRTQFLDGRSCKEFVAIS